MNNHLAYIWVLNNIISSKNEQHLITCKKLLYNFIAQLIANSEDKFYANVMINSLIEKIETKSEELNEILYQK